MSPLLVNEAVQSERKPFDVQREKPSNCAASTEKIYIRKDLRSPLIATPTFVADKDGARSAPVPQRVTWLHLHLEQQSSIAQYLSKVAVYTAHELRSPTECKLMVPSFCDL